MTSTFEKASSTRTRPVSNSTVLGGCLCFVVWFVVVCVCVLWLWVVLVCGFVGRGVAGRVVSCRVVSVALRCVSGRVVSDRTGVSGCRLLGKR
jgi:hypothetical protein